MHITKPNKLISNWGMKMATRRKPHVGSKNFIRCSKPRKLDFDKFEK